MRAIRRPPPATSRDGTSAGRGRPGGSPAPDGGADATLIIEAPGAAATRPFVQGLMIDGKPTERTWLRHDDLRRGLTVIGGRSEALVRFKVNPLAPAVQTEPAKQSATPLLPSAVPLEERVCAETLHVYHGHDPAVPNSDRPDF
jgi:hypothetical protein